MRVSNGAARAEFPLLRVAFFARYRAENAGDAVALSPPCQHLAPVAPVVAPLELFATPAQSENSAFRAPFRRADPESLATPFVNIFHSVPAAVSDASFAQFVVA